MRGNLYPTTVYLDEESKRSVALLAKTTGKPKAEIVRTLITEGLKTIQTKHSASAQALLDIIGSVSKESGLPADLSTNHDSYTWDK